MSEPGPEIPICDQPNGMQPEGVHDSPAAQHSHEKRHAVVPGAHASGSHVPSTHD